MPLVPAVCDNCGRLFSSGIELINSEVSFVDSGAGPCPHCGGNGRILSGVYNTLGETLSILIDPTNPGRAPGFLEVLKQIRDQNASPEEVRETIKRVEPQLRGLLTFLRDRENRKEVYIVIGLLIALLTLYLKGERRCPPTQINNLVEKVTAEAMAPNLPNRKARRTQQSKARHK
jgi:hypothetical protein